MGFSVTVADLPTLFGYSDAKKHYDGIIPIRNKVPELRPLGDRRAYHKTIVESTENGVSYIGCCLYGSEVVKFFADGRITISTCGHNTVSTAVFIRRVVASVHNSSTFGNAIWICLSRSRQYLINTKNNMTINKDDTVEATPCVVHVIKRKELKEVAKQYKAFTDYTITMHKLTKGEIEHDFEAVEITNKSGFASLKANDDLNLFAAWGSRILQESTHSAYRRGANGWSYVTECKLSTVKTNIKKYIKRNHPEVFERVELPLGEVKADNNYRFVRNNRSV
jgi:hypothetical protein